MSSKLARWLTCAAFAVLPLVSPVGAAPNPCRGACKATKKACVHAATAAYAAAATDCAAEQNPADRRSCKRAARAARATAKAACKSALTSCVSDDNCLPSCGNGLLEAGETCDPVSACMTTQNACVANANTIVTTSGSAAACTFVCNRVQRTCGPADGFCPTNVTCGPTTDLDCAGCGNGRIDGGETCDVAPAAITCTSITCNDGNACTTDTRRGSNTACNVTCGHTDITACANGDGCCAPGCNAANDDDCGVACGNGVREGGETCEVGPATPLCTSITCDDGNTCTTDVRNGSNAACDVTCTNTPITACVSGDGCCPGGGLGACNHNNDTDCAALCGNGVVEAPETCDSSPANPICANLTCNDGNACTTDVRSGSDAACNVTCSHSNITACILTRDGCCPAGCTDFADDDCAPRNDTCASATDISSGGDFPFALLNAKQNLAAAACAAAAGGGAEVFFTFTLTTPSAVYLDVFDPAGDTVNVALELYGGGCPAAGATPLDCDVGSGAKNCGDANPWPRILDTHLDNGTYVVAARVINDLPGRHTLRFQRVPDVCIASGLLAALQVGNTCSARGDQYSPSCAASGDDETYFLVKCPGTGLTVDTCASRTQIDTVLQVNEASIDLVNGKCVLGTNGKAIGCNDDSRCPTNTGTSTITNTGRGARGIFTVTVDTFSTTRCGVYELNAAVLP